MLFTKLFSSSSEEGEYIQSNFTAGATETHIFTGCCKPGTTSVTKPDAESSLPHILQPLLFTGPFPAWFRCWKCYVSQSFTSVEVQITWKLNPALHLDTKHMLNKHSVPFSWWGRLGHSIYSVTVPKKDTEILIWSLIVNSLEFLGRQHAFSMQTAFGETCCCMKGVLQAVQALCSISPRQHGCTCRN